MHQGGREVDKHLPARHPGESRDPFLRMWDAELFWQYLQQFNGPRLSPG
jgi:hypothetical protein